jgi:uncharacterized protein YqeY
VGGLLRTNSDPQRLDPGRWEIIVEMSQQASSLKVRIQADMKSALKSGDKRRLGIVRLMLAAVKQREIDERIELQDEQVLAVLDRMLKQRRESEEQYRRGGRDDLADQEACEIRVVQEYMPAALTAQELEALIRGAIADSAAASIRDMGKVMALLKPKVQGRADMAAISRQVKGLLGSS